MNSVLPADTGASERTQKLSKTAGYYLAFLTLGMTGASLGPTLPGLAENTRTSLSEISFLFSARSLGYLIGSLLAGRLYDRVPGHPVLFTTLAVMAATMILVPILPLLWLLTLVLLLVGVAEGTLDVGGNTLLVWVHRERVGPFMNGLHFFFGVGAFLSPLIIAQAVLWSGSITWGYWAIAFLLLFPLLWIARFPSPAAHESSTQNPSRKTDDHLVLLVAIFFFLYVGAEGSFGGWVYTYARSLNLGSETTAAYLTSAFWGALTVGRLLAIPLAVRFRPRWILLTDLAGCLGSMAVILVWRHSPAALWVGTIGLGLSMASIFPTTISLAERRMTITGKVTSWFFVGASLGGMSVPWVIGQLFESIGPSVTMVTILLSLTLATAVYAVMLFRPPSAQT